MPSEQLAGDYTVVGKAQNYPEEITNDPTVTRLPDGKLLFTYEIQPRYMGMTEAEIAESDGEERTHLKISDDEGNSWEDLTVLEGLHAFHPFVVEGTLYALAHTPRRRDIVITRSTDGGAHWEQPVTLFEGRYWNTPTPTVTVGDTIYTAYEKRRPGDTVDDGSVVLAGDLTRELLAPDAWRISNPVYYPGSPTSLQTDPTSPGFGMWLEGNVVDVRGDLRVYLRPRGVDSTNLAGICEFTDDGTDIDHAFRQFHAVPGADCKFNIRYDAQSDLFWMTCNVKADSQDSLGLDGKADQIESDLGRADRYSSHTIPGDRRTLMLYYSVDALNWFEAGCIAQGPSLWESFMYPYFVIDGDDILVAVRSCSEEAFNQHDSDRVTVHRVGEFRSLTGDIHPSPVEVAKLATRETPGPR